MTSAYAKLAQLNPFRYRGYVWDEETELYYLRSRYYDPAWGRFLNADIILGNISSLLEHSLFSYCKNSSISFLDNTGLARIGVNIYIKEWDYGHADITIMHDDGLKMTYSYGRYGEVYGILGLSGEGILKIYEGDRHIQDHLNKGRTMYRYELDMTDEEITRLLMFYEDFAGRDIAIPGEEIQRNCDVK